MNKLHSLKFHSWTKNLKVVKVLALKCCQMQSPKKSFIRTKNLTFGCVFSRDATNPLKCTQIWSYIENNISVSKIKFKNFQSSSKSFFLGVQCQFCNLTMATQNFKRHLKKRHREKNTWTWPWLYVDQNIRLQEDVKI